MSDTIKDGRDPGFYIVDNEIIDHFGPIVGVYGVAVYNVLLKYASKAGDSAFPSYQTIADSLGMSRPKAISTIKQLVEVGLVKKAERHKQSGDQTSNEYTIVSVKGGKQHLPPSKPDLPPLVNVVNHPSKPRLPDQDPINKTQMNKSKDDHRRRLSLPPEQPKRTRQTDPDYDRICTSFESDGFGMLTPILAGQVDTMLDSYPVEWIVDAMAIAVARSSRNLAYVNGILRNFSTEGHGKQGNRTFADAIAEHPEINQPPTPQAASAPIDDNGPLAQVWRSVVEATGPSAREWLADAHLRSVTDGCAVITAPARSAQYINNRLGNQIRRHMATAGCPVERVRIQAAEAAESEAT